MRRYSEGHSLVEILLACALLTLVMLVLLTAFITGKRSQAQQSESEKAARACLVAVEHLRKHLRVATVEMVHANGLQYRVVTRDAQGQVQFGPTGEPIWSPQYFVTLQGQKLMREHQGQMRTLVDLGPTPRFELAQEQLNLVRVEVHSGFGNGYTLTTRILLNNQF